MDISESVDRILHARDALGKLFYDLFLNTCPEVRHHFHGVDLDRQYIALVTALMAIERYYTHPTPAVEQYLQYLGAKHCEMGIPEGAYAQWIEQMVEAMVRFHGPRWTAGLAVQWREAIGKATGRMLDGYRQRAAV